MGLPIGEMRSITLHKSIEKSVICESCSHEYSYSTERSATGSGFSFLYLEGQIADQNARDRARTALEREVAEAIEIVPCPKCYCYQLKMLPLVRATHLLWLRNAAILGFVAASVTFLAGVTATDHAQHDAIPAWSIAVPAVLSLCCLTLTLLRMWLISQWDPNSEPLNERRRIAEIYGQKFHVRAHHTEPDDIVNSVKRSVAQPSQHDSMSLETARKSISFFTILTRDEAIDIWALIRGFGLMVISIGIPVYVAIFEPRNPKANNLVSVVVFLALYILGFFMVGSTLYAARRTFRFIRNGRATEGYVRSVATIPAVVISFAYRVDGVDYTNQCASNRVYDVGDSIVVAYSPDEPCESMAISCFL